MREATDTDDALAVCMAVCRADGVRIELASLHFSASKISLELVTHEVLHGIVKFAKKHRLLKARHISDQHEEKLAYAFGTTTNRIANKLKKLKLVK